MVVRLLRALLFRLTYLPFLLSHNHERVVVHSVPPVADVGGGAQVGLVVFNAVDEFRLA